MLNAVTQGKAGRVAVGGETPVSWRALYTSSEDLLTATVFERLSYLPPHHFITVLAVTFGLPFPHMRAPMIDLEFWPRWKPDDQSDRVYVEPDVFLRVRDDATGFAQDLIVEAKPKSNVTPQCDNQWSEQIQAYATTMESQPKSHLRFLALGGLGRDYKTRTQIIQTKVQLPESSGLNVSFHGADWMTLRRAVERLRGLHCCQDSLLDDICTGLDLAGHRDWVLFETMTDAPSGRFENALIAFSNLEHLKA